MQRRHLLQLGVGSAPELGAVGAVGVGSAWRCPQLSIYSLVTKLATQLALDLGGRRVRLAA